MDLINQMDIKLDSNEEKYYIYWLDELVKANYILNYKYHVTIPILDNKYINLQVLRGKKKISEEHQFKLLSDITYEADFLIEWNTDMFHDNGKFWFIENQCVNGLPSLLKTLHYAQLSDDNKILSYVDVKGTFAGIHNNSAVIFPIKQKLIYDKLGIYINSIKPLSDKGLFAHTFTPQLYMKTDITKKDRVISWNTKTLEQYINE